MHYKNGREAKNGDMIMSMASFGGPPVIGILYDAKAGNDNCNGHVALVTASDPRPCLNECLHVDDVKAAVKAYLEPPKPEVTA